MNRTIVFLFAIQLYYSTSVVAQQCPKKFIEAQYQRQFYPPGAGLSQQYPLIGLYREALQEQDRYDDGVNISVINDGNTQAVNAYPYIYNAIRTNDIIIINECHTMPQHRALLYSIADSFSTLGVQSLFLEALAYTPDDSVYSSYSNDVFGALYTGENVYNQTIHKLLNKNIIIRSYELNNDLDTTTIKNKKYVICKQERDWIPISADDYVIKNLFSTEDYAQRDAQQALHIYEKMLKNSLQKIVVFCGYSHAWKAKGHMAGILEHISKKKIFSIDQMILNEHFNTGLEDKLFAKYANTEYPLTFVNDKRQLIHKIYFPVTKDSLNFLVDMEIATPRSVYVDNRPTWLELGKDRKRYPLSKYVDVKTLPKDVLVAVYENNEYNSAKREVTPEDIIQVIGEANNYDVILTPQKKYRMLIYKDGKIIVNLLIDTL